MKNGDARVCPAEVGREQFGIGVGAEPDVLV